MSRINCGNLLLKHGMNTIKNDSLMWTEFNTPFHKEIILINYKYHQLEEHLLPQDQSLSN